MDSATLDQRMLELMGGLKTEDEEDIKVVENECENEGESSDENLQEEAEDKFVEDEKELGGGHKKKSFAFVRFRVRRNCYLLLLTSKILCQPSLQKSLPLCSRSAWSCK